MTPRVAIVDTGSGNLRSVEKALAVAGAAPFVTSDPERVAAADKVVVPGQGAFGGCVAGLERGGGALREAVLDAVGRGVPYLGLCLGLQVLFDGSDEDPSCRGLGLVRGRVRRFDLKPPVISGTPGGSPNPPASGPVGQSPPVPTRLKVPHMGWNACQRGPAATRSRVIDGAPDASWFYFVHSYYPVPDDAGDVALSAEHGVRFCAAVARDNVVACQFHPEKSQRAGLELLGRFVSL